MNFPGKSRLLDPVVAVDPQRLITAVERQIGVQLGAAVAAILVDDFGYRLVAVCQMEPPVEGLWVHARSAASCVVALSSSPRMR